MRLVLLSLVALIVSGCGYSFSGMGGSMPGNVESLYIPLMTNQTSEPRIEHNLTSYVTRVFTRSGKVNIFEQGQSVDAILDGKIVSYTNRAVSYDSNDDISEYRSTMIVDVELVRNDIEKQILWHKTVTWSTDYSASNNKALQEDREDQAIDELSSRLAEELYDQLMNSF
jgi:outer membrane lipopolysaccharide assembly protein LptE/RlpB